MIIFKSATKITLLSLILATVIALFVGKVSEQNFMLVVLPVIAFYFGQKTPTTPQV